MNNEGSAAQAAMAKHHNYMSFGKKQRYIEVFQCSGEDMHLVLTGGGAANGALSPVAAKALLSPPGMLPAQPLITTGQVANPGTPVPALMPAWDPMSVYAQNLAQTLALQRAAMAAAQQQQQQQQQHESWLYQLAQHNQLINLMIAKQQQDMNGGMAQQPNIQSIISPNATQQLLDNSAQNYMAKSAAAAPYMYFNMPRFPHNMASKSFVPVSAAGGQFVMPPSANSPQKRSWQHAFPGGAESSNKRQFAPPSATATGPMFSMAQPPNAAAAAAAAAAMAASPYLQHPAQFFTI